MAIVNFKNSPSEETPLTGDASGTLNVMQENGTTHGSDTKLGYSQAFLNDHIVNVSNEVDEDYRVNVLHSKNLFNQNGVWTNNGITYTFNKQRLTINGTSSSEGGYTSIGSTPQLAKLPAGTYTLSINEVSGTRSGSSNLIIRNLDASSNFIDLVYNPNNTYTFTLTTETRIGFNLYQLGSGRVYTNYVIDLQLEEGSTATSYEPYITPSIYVDNEEIYSKPSFKDYYNDITLNTTNVNINSNNLHYYKKRSDGLIVFTITLSAKVDMTSGTAYDLFTIPSDVNPTSNFPYIVGSYNKGYGVAYIQSQTRLMIFKPFQNLAIGDEIHLTGCYYQS